MENQPVQGQGSGVPSASQPSFLYRYKRSIGILILFLIFLVAVFVAVILIFFKKPPADLAAKVGDREIKVAEVEAFAGECELDKKEAVEYLVDDIALAAWASDEKITITEEDQKNEEVRVGGIQNPPPCNATRAKVNLLREKLSQNTNAYREGQLIVVNFGLFANPNPIQITEGDEDNRE